MTEVILYKPEMNNAEKRAAILGIGQERGLWKHWGVHEGRYVVQFTGHDAERYLTGDEVDRLPFDHFADQENWT